MKQLPTLLCACALALALAACAVTAAPSAASDAMSAAAPNDPSAASNNPSSAPVTVSSDVPEPAAGGPLPDGVEWAVQPTLACTFLSPSTLARGGEQAFYNTVGFVSPDGLSKVMIDGKYGLIDHDGQWAVPCEFDSVYCGHGGAYVLEKYAAPESGEANANYIYEPGAGLRQVAPDETNPDGSGVLVSITGTSSNPMLCYVPERDEMYQWSDATVWPIYEASLKPDYPVAALYFVAEEYQKDNGTWIPDFDGDVFVLTDGKHPVSDERYQSIGCVAEGVVPARRSGGRWGYLDTAGNAVFPFEYDGGYLYYADYDYAAHRPLDEGFVARGGAFQATEGTVALHKGNTAALYTVGGEELIPFGVFEELAPLRGGRLWAKYGGKWGVLSLSARDGREPLG